MVEGLTWEWESFPEFLEALEKRRHDINMSVYVPHSALRVYVMGERAARREQATEEEFLEFCKEKMTGYKRPRNVEFRESLPVSVVGKVLRRVLKEEELKKQKGPDQR